MQFFYQYFGRDNHENDRGEMFVKCPFTHTDENGQPYYESNPSAHINIDKSAFHCKVCAKGMSEAQFISELQGVSYKDALSLLAMMEDHTEDTWTAEKTSFHVSSEARKLTKSLNIMEVADELQLGFEPEKGGISFPVFVYGELLDVRNYVPGRKTKDGRSIKVLSRKGAKPLILPFDLWIDSVKDTLLLAGEKDMAIGRKHGFNAITFTGGERSIPKLFKASFKGRKVYIAYDNDRAGIDGANAVAVQLKEWGAFPYVVKGHYEVCTEKGEDIHDFFEKYGKTKEDLTQILKDTPVFTETEYREERAKVIPNVTIDGALDPKYKGRFVSSNVSVVSVFDDVHQVPDYVEFEKIQVSDGYMEVGDKKAWALGESNLHDILYLMEKSITDEKQHKNLKMIAGLSKEKGIAKKVLSSVNIYKSVVADAIESSTDHDVISNPKEIVAYCVGKRMDPGKRYQITYKVPAHPQDQHLVAIVTEIEESSQSISKFQVTNDVKASLECFKVKEGQTVTEKMLELFERSKGYIGVAARPDIFFATDLFFHTPLKFRAANDTHRGTLDCIIVGDERTGKSKTAKELIELYEVGIIASLKTTTEAGLIGGSDQSLGGYKTKLGILPRNNRGAVILEEFSGGGKELISRLTEIRSSQRVRIGRVNGSLEAEAQVRMLSISNPMARNGKSMPVRSYPHGISILRDLIGNSEDISRYDYVLVVGSTGEYISPLEKLKLEPYPKQAYMNRVRWIWSRKPEQVTITDEVVEYIFNKQTELNRSYDADIKLFGPETWMKLSRLSVAAAGIVCSMDETGEKIIVTKEHVDWAADYMLNIYDNEIFRLGQYVQSQRRYTVCDDAAVHMLQQIYTNHAVMLHQLEIESEMTRQQLEAVSGLDRRDFNKVVNSLVKGFFLELSGDKMMPTLRFRTAMKHVGSVYPKGVGEE